MDHSKFLDSPVETGNNDVFLDNKTEDHSAFLDSGKELSTGQALVQTGKELGKEATQFMADQGLQFGGMAAGASAGLEVATPLALASGPLAPFVEAAGAIGGAYIGGTAGQATKEAIDAGVNAIAPGTTKPKTPGEVIKSVGEAGKLGAEAEMFGRGVGTTVQRAGKAILPALESRAPNVVRAVKSALSANILPSMAQITQSRALATLEEMASKVPIIGPRIMAMRAEQEAGYNSLRNEVLSKFGPENISAPMAEQTEKDIGQYLNNKLTEREKEIAQLHQKTVSKLGPSEESAKLGQQLDSIRVLKTEEARKSSAKLYEELDKAIPDSSNHVKDDNVRQISSDFLEQYKNLPSSSLDGKIKKLLSDIKSGPGNKVIENSENPIVLFNPSGQAIGSKEAKAMAERKAYTFGEMQTLRSTLSSMAEQERMKVPGQITNEGRILLRLKDAVDKDIEAFSNGLPGDIKRLKQVADANYASYKTTFANPTMGLLGRTAKQNPEDVYRLLIKPGDVSDIRRVKNVVGESGFQPLRRKFVNDLITGADGKMLSGPEIMHNMSKMGFETLKEVLNPNQIKDVLSSVQERNLPKFIQSEMEQNLRNLIVKGGGISRAPEEIVKRVMDADTDTIKALKNVVGEKGLIPYKRKILEEIIGLPTASTSPTSFRIGRNLSAYGNSLKELFNPDELADIKKIDDIKTLLESQGKLQANYSGTASTLLAGGAMAELLLNPTKAGVFIYHNPVTAATTILTPEILSRFYVSKAGRKLLIEGMSEDIANKAMLASRISSFIIAANKEILDESMGRSIKPSEEITEEKSPTIMERLSQ